jgi:hypothetical protein
MNKVVCIVCDKHFSQYDGSWVREELGAEFVFVCEGCE